MRVKKQKRHRRTVRFFAVVFGFREPYKVLCDGTFIHHLICNDIVPADKAISNILGGPVKLFTTRCVIGEVKRMGASYSDALQVARELIVARCDHERMKSADACLSDIIGENNAGHFFLATQDADLRKKLREVPGVPLLFALRNALLLESPSEFQHQFAKNSESQRLRTTEAEQIMLKGKIKTMGDDEESQNHDENGNLGNQDLVAQPIHKKIMASRGLNVKDGPQFKRKRAKAPNPLSVKKKQKKSQDSQNRDTLKEHNRGEYPTTKRKRRRSHKDNNQIDVE